MTLDDVAAPPLEGASQPSRVSLGAILAAAGVITAIGVVIGIVATHGSGSGHVSKKPANTLTAAPKSTTSRPSAPNTGALTNQASAAPAQQGGPCPMRPPGSTYPDARFGAALAATADGAVLYGGRGADFRDRTDGFLIDCSGWARAALKHAPPAMDADSPVAIAYDPAIGQAVLVGSGATWAWNGSDWTNRGSAPRLSSPQLAYDTARTQLVLVGGGGETMETWSWDGTAWTQRAGSAPSYRGAFALVYDPIRTRTYLFGGATEGGSHAPSDLWAWDGSRWTHLSPAHTPPSGPVMAAFDGARNVTIGLAFNGAGGVAETWQWDGTDWTKLAPAHTPRRRLFGSMVYVPVIQRVVVFGGKTNTVTQQPGQLPTGVEQIVNDLWMWSGTDWTQLH
jgi:hypothetical protein